MRGAGQEARVEQIRDFLGLAGELGIPVVEQIIPRELLYISDEVFFSGTAAEITPAQTWSAVAFWPGMISRASWIQSMISYSVSPAFQRMASRVRWCFRVRPERSGKIEWR